VQFSMDETSETVTPPEGSLDTVTLRGS